jgi:hypothetical protein
VAGLSDEDAIERVAVVPREAAGLEGVHVFDRDRHDAGDADALRHEDLRWLREAQATESVLDGDLQAAGRRKQELVVSALERGAGIAEPLRRREHPSNPGRFARYPHVVGFCYTQLTDVEQERNGLLDAERRPKFPIEVLRGVVRGA